MHVLVKQGEPEEVAALVPACRQRLEARRERVVEVSQHPGARQPRDLPAVLVGGDRGIEARVGVGEDGGGAFALRVVVPVSQAPELLEPRDVRELPERRIHEFELREDDRRVVQVVVDPARPLASIAKGSAEGFRFV